MIWRASVNANVSKMPVKSSSQIQFRLIREQLLLVTSKTNFTKKDKNFIKYSVKLRQTQYSEHSVVQSTTAYSSFASNSLLLAVKSCTQRDTQFEPSYCFLPLHRILLFNPSSIPPGKQLRFQLSAWSAWQYSTLLSSVCVLCNLIKQRTTVSVSAAASPANARNEKAKIKWLLRVLNLMRSRLDRSTANCAAEGKNFKLSCKVCEERRKMRRRRSMKR